jgi:regulator of protease activity HflC (stomatin/prohibitin superfamily)
MAPIDPDNPQRVQPGGEAANQSHGPHDPDDIAGFDSGQQALSDALRVSFAVLKVVMFALLVVYLVGSGMFIVDEGTEKVIRLRFGQIVGGQEPKVYESDWHLGLPYPIEQRIHVPITSQSLNITDAFWYEGEADDRQKALDPAAEGYLLTGDAGIVHARFRVDYAIAEPVQFVRHVDGLTGSKAQSAASAQALVRAVAEQALGQAVAQMPADGVVAGNANTGQARAIMQNKLDAMDSGIRVEGVSIQGDPTMPATVREAYRAVTSAENQKEQQIEAARNERERILGSAAGEAGLPESATHAGPLLTLIDRYQQAVRAEETQKARKLDGQIAAAFRELQVASAEDRPVRIGGEAARIINEARSYADEVEQAVLTERNTFLELYEQYQKSPRILINRLWQDTRETILASDSVETIYSMEGRPYIVTNRAPNNRQTNEEQNQPVNDEP